MLRFQSIATISINSPFSWFYLSNALGYFRPMSRFIRLYSQNPLQSMIEKQEVCINFYILWTIVHLLLSDHFYFKRLIRFFSFAIPQHSFILFAKSPEYDTLENSTITDFDLIFFFFWIPSLYVERHSYIFNNLITI